MGTSSTAGDRERGDAEGFVDFFRRYTKTWVHGVSTAGLTGFGMLTFVHRWFAVLAIASYVAPPVGLYFVRGQGATGSTADGVDGTEAPSAASRDADADAPESTGSAEAPSDAVTGPPPEARTDSDDPASGRRDFDADGRATAGASLETTDAEQAADSGRAAGDAPEPEREPRWTAAESPTDATLFDVAETGAGAVAVGEGGVAVATDGGEWTVELEDGPGANGETLYGVDVTDDGAVAWVAGDNGAVGRLEVETGRHVDRSAPNDLTDNLTGIAVSGAAGDETVLLINGSGEVLRGRYRDGDLAWDSPVKPGSGSSLVAVALAGDVGYCCDTNDGVFATADGGRTFERVGLEGADGTLAALAPDGEDDCLVATDAGVVHRYDGNAWTPERVDDETLTGIARDGDRVAVCGADGDVRERADPASDWTRIATSAPGPLRGVALGPERGGAVGDEGAVLERR